MRHFLVFLMISFIPSTALGEDYKIFVGPQFGIGDTLSESGDGSMMEFGVEYGFLIVDDRCLHQVTSLISPHWSFYEESEEEVMSTSFRLSYQFGYEMLGLFVGPRVGGGVYVQFEDEDETLIQLTLEGGIAVFWPTADWFGMNVHLDYIYAPEDTGSRPLMAVHTMIVRMEAFFTFG